MTGRRERVGATRGPGKRGRRAVEEARRRRKIVADGQEGREKGQEWPIGSSKGPDRIHKPPYSLACSRLRDFSGEACHLGCCLSALRARDTIAPGQIHNVERTAVRGACAWPSASVYTAVYHHILRGYYPGYPCRDHTLTMGVVPTHILTANHLPPERSQPSAPSHLYFRLPCLRGLRSFPLTNAACGCLHCHQVNRLEALQIPSTSRNQSRTYSSTATTCHSTLQATSNSTLFTYLSFIIRVTGM